MKRSRTCQCLVELDSPKRTRSTPDLAALRRKHHIFERERTLDDSMMTPSVGLDGPLHILWRAPSPVAKTAAAAAAAAVSAAAATAAAGASAIATATAPVAGSSEAFVVDSVVRRGSLNEITILEHEQFIDSAGGGRTASGLIFGPGGRASPAGLLLDYDSGGDSSDYFCGVASSDEAEEDSRCGGTTTTTATTTNIATNNASTIGSGSSGSGGFDPPCIITPNMSDAESAGQVSDASSHAAVKDHAGDDDDTAGVHVADGAESPPLAAPAAPPSYSDKPRNYGFAASFPPTRFASGSGNAWRQQQQQQQPSRSRVTVRVTTSSLGVSGDLSGVSSPFSEEGREEEKDRQQHATSQTVSPPWPYLVSASAWRGAPASAPAAFYGDSLAAAAAAAAAGGVYVVPESHTMRSQQYHRSNDNLGGSIFSPGEEVKILGGFDRLRLVDHHPKQPPVVGMGVLDPVWTCRGRESSSLGVGMEMEADSALQG